MGWILHPLWHNLADAALEVMEDLTKPSSAWAPVLSAVAAAETWSSHPDMAATLRLHLAQERPALREQAQRIEACFYKVKIPQS